MLSVLDHQIEVDYGLTARYRLQKKGTQNGLEQWATFRSFLEAF